MVNLKKKKVGGKKLRRKRRKVKVKKPVVEDPEVIEYRNQVSAFEAQLQQLVFKFSGISKVCSDLAQERKDVCKKYHDVLSQKEASLSQRKNYLQYLAQKKKEFSDEKSELEETEKLRAQLHAEKAEKIKEWINRRTKKLSMENVVAIGEIKVLDDMRILKELLENDTKEAEEKLALQEAEFARELNLKLEEKNSTAYTLKTQREERTTNFRQEYRRAFQMSKTYEFKKIIKLNAETTLNFYKYSSSVFDLFKNTHSLLREESLLKHDMDVKAYLRETLIETTVRQKRRIAKIKETVRMMSTESKNIERKSKDLERVKALLEELVEKLQNIRMEESEISRDCMIAKDHLKQATDKRQLLRLKCSELVFVLKATEIVVRNENLDLFADAGVNPLERDRLLQRFLEIVDTANYLTLSDCDFGHLEFLFRKGPIKGYSTPTGRSLASVVRSAPSGEHRQKRVTFGILRRTPASVDMKIKILGEMGLITKYRNKL